MSFLGKRFGPKTPPPEAPPVPAAPAAPADPAKDPNRIRVHDAYGREMFITKQQWPGNVITRMVFGETLRRLKEVQSAAVEAYRDKILLLQKEKPLPPPAQAIQQRLFTEVCP